MDALPLISILVIVFAMILITEMIRLKRDVRKLSRLTRNLRKDIDLLKSDLNDK